MNRFKAEAIADAAVQAHDYGSSAAELCRQLLKEVSTTPPSTYFPAVQVLRETVQAIDRLQRAYSDIEHLQAILRDPKSFK